MDVPMHSWVLMDPYRKRISGEFLKHQFHFQKQNQAKENFRSDPSLEESCSPHPAPWCGLLCLEARVPHPRSCPMGLTIAAIPEIRPDDVFLGEAEHAQTSPAHCCINDDT